MHLDPSIRGLTLLLSCVLRSKFREWQIGATLFSLGNVANFISFGYAAQSLLAAIGCIQFVSNVLFASWVLKEQVCAGCVS